MTEREHLPAAVAWADFARAAPEIAEFGAGRLALPPAYLATVGKDGTPRVHPVTPILNDQGLFVFMEPTSPKGRDLRERGSYCLHNGVPDTEGSGGEFFVRGQGAAVESAAARALVARAASYEPHDTYVLFELKVAEARCKAYGDVALPSPRRWVAPGA